MGNLTNLVGAAGEYMCVVELTRPVAGARYLFEPILLGAKAPTYDYIVHLLDAGENRAGPFFFLQVKTISTGVRRDGTYPFTFHAADVRRTQTAKVPFFLCLVDRSVPRAERIFIRGVDSIRSRGITRIAPVFDLATDVVKLGLYDEVTRIWAAMVVPPLTKFV